jgi:hypothetical protein
MASPYRELKERAWAANQEIPKRGLAIYTFGNVSALDADRGVIAIKPSGVAYDELKADDLVVLDLEGRIVEGRLRPSSDTPTHLVLYRNWKGTSAQAHSHLWDDPRRPPGGRRALYGRDGGRRRRERLRGRDRAPDSGVLQRP